MPPPVETELDQFIDHLYQTTLVLPPVIRSRAPDRGRVIIHAHPTTSQMLTNHAQRPAAMGPVGDNQEPAETFLVYGCGYLPPVLPGAGRFQQMDGLRRNPLRQSKLVGELSLGKSGPRSERPISRIPQFRRKAFFV